MQIMIREGTHEKNFEDLIPLINDFNSFHISLVSDDRDPIDLREKGHLNYLIRKAIYINENNLANSIIFSKQVKLIKIGKLQRMIHLLVLQSKEY